MKPLILVETYLSPKKGNMIYMRNWERSVKLDPTEIWGKMDHFLQIKMIFLKKNSKHYCEEKRYMHVFQSKDFCAVEGIISELFKVDEVYNILYMYGLSEHVNAQEIYCDNLFKLANLCGAADGNIKLKLFIFMRGNSIEAVGRGFEVSR